MKQTQGKTAGGTQKGKELGGRREKRSGGVYVGSAAKEGLTAKTGGGNKLLTELSEEGRKRGTDGRASP